MEWEPLPTPGCLGLGWLWMPAVEVEGIWHHQDPLSSGPSPVETENDHRAQKSLTQARSQAPFFIKTRISFFTL